MKKFRNKEIDNDSFKFNVSNNLNQDTYFDYMMRFKRIATSIFEWVNLPDTMNARRIEEDLFFYGEATFLKSKKYGFINTKCCGDGSINIYGLPSRFNCYSYTFNEFRRLYTGLKDTEDDKECILVMNNYDRLATYPSLELFANRITKIERTCDVNVSQQRFPCLILGDEKQRLSLRNIYSQYDGNQPVIFGKKKQFQDIEMKVIDTKAPFIIDKLMDYKKELWNEVLTYLGINSILTDKKERLTESESNVNNEVVNLNLQAMLTPRLQACKQFNDYFGFTGTDKEISVRVRSDLKNIIKENMSIVSDFIVGDENE